MKIYLKKSGDRFGDVLELKNKAELKEFVVEEHGNADWRKNPNKMTIDELCDDRWDDGWRRCDKRGE